MSSSEDVFSLKHSLEAALDEIDTDLRHAHHDSDDEQAEEHKQALQERREQLQGLLAALKDKFDSKDEVEVREDLSAEDDALVQSRLSGRRVAHVPSWPGCESKTAGEGRMPSIMKARIVERPEVDKQKVLQRESDMSRRVLMADIEKRMMGERAGRSKSEVGGIYPPAADGDQ